MSRISITKIAKDLDISATTVSVALRGKKGVSDELRHKIINHAETLGYSPDPVSSELMAYVRSSRRPAGAETIAFINSFEHPEYFDIWPGFNELLNGAADRAAGYGYKIERFDVYKDKISPQRLVDILHARGIRGVIVGPRWKDENAYDFPVNEFSCVGLGETMINQKIHRVCNDQTQCSCSALQALSQKGYRRIVVGLNRLDEIKSNYHYSLGVSLFSKLSKSKTTKVLLYKNHDETYFMKQLEQYQADAFVTLSILSDEFVKKITNKLHLGYANLNLPHDFHWSGINQNSDLIGSRALELVKSLLDSGERGGTEAASTLLVPGSWVDGNTTT